MRTFRGWLVELFGFLGRLRRGHPLAFAGLILFAFLAVVCAAAGVITPFDPIRQDLPSRRLPPSLAHWMGTDDLGRDVLSRVLYGGRISIAIGILAALVGTGLGAVIGAVSGYVGGWVDEVLMRFTDMAYSIPGLPVLIVLAGILRPSVTGMALIIGALSWMSTARIVRVEVQSIRERPYVDAARTLGLRHGLILRRHVIPNAAGAIIVGVTLAVGDAIILESSLSFLGLGIQPPTATWGNLLTDAGSTMRTAPWLTIFPGLAILLTVLAINYLGDGLRDALDPTSKSS